MTTEFIDNQGRIVRQERDADNLTRLTVLPSARIKCAKCGWTTSAKLDMALETPRRCFCGGRLEPVR